MPTTREPAYVQTDFNEDAMRKKLALCVERKLALGHVESSLRREFHTIMNRLSAYGVRARQLHDQLQFIAYHREEVEKQWQDASLPLSSDGPTESCSTLPPAKPSA